MTNDDRRKEFFALMQRFNQLGALLPDLEEFDPADAAALAEAKVVLAEMNETKAAMERLASRQRTGRD